MWRADIAKYWVNVYTGGLIQAYADVGPSWSQNALAKSRYVLQCWVYGNSFETSLVAIVAPDKDSVLSHCQKMGIQGDLAQVIVPPSPERHATGRDEFSANLSFPEVLCAADPMRERC